MTASKQRHPYESVRDELRQGERWRFLRTWEGAGGVFTHEGRRFLNFSSNDYLGLSGHPALAAAVTEVMKTQGCGATASRLMSGNLSIHDRLEADLAELMGREHALVFPSGYQANVGVLTSLAGKGDHIYSDALNHASLIDGARLSRAKIHVYRHNDMEHLAALLEEGGAEGRRVIVTDSVFSMDGDVAALCELSTLAARHGAVLVVDEAHAVGIWGEGGGVSRALGVNPDVLTGTLGKALGSGGGFVACDGVYRDLLINRARSFIYSTGVSPMNGAAARAALGMLREDPSRGATLLGRAGQFQALLVERGVDVVVGKTQILPVMVGDERQVMDYAAQLLDAGLIVTGIRPPTVPEGTSRLRFSVTLGHDLPVLEEAADVIARVLVG